MGNEKDDLFSPGELVLIPAGTQLQVDIEGVSSRLKSTLVGMAFEKCIIMEAPFANTIKNRLFKGNKLIVRFMYEGTIFGFQSEVIEAMFEPLKLIFVSYPKIIARHDLRSQKRIESFLPAEIAITDDVYRSVILDINERGCRCIIKASKDEKLPNITINGRLILKFQLPGVEDRVAISGKVKNFQRDIKELQLGIQFHEITQQVQNKINQYISSVESF